MRLNFKYEDKPAKALLFKDIIPGMWYIIPSEYNGGKDYLYHCPVDNGTNKKIVLCFDRTASSIGVEEIAWSDPNCEIEEVEASGIDFAIKRTKPLRAKVKK